jgi:hypothetical protein
MSIGGHREGAGRRSEFRTATDRIRLPKAHHDKLREIAHKLEEKEAVVFGTELERAIEDILKTVPPSRRSSVARLLNRLKGVIGMGNR